MTKILMMLQFVVVHQNACPRKCLQDVLYDKKIIFPDISIFLGFIPRLFPMWKLPLVYGITAGLRRAPQSSALT